MKTRSVLLIRILETVFLVGVIVTAERADRGYSWSILVLNSDFTFGFARAGSAMLLNTRLVGYAASLLATLLARRVGGVGLFYLSLVLATLGLASVLSETLRALGLLNVSAQFGCSVALCVVDWFLFARLKHAQGLANRAVAT